MQSYKLTLLEKHSTYIEQEEGEVQISSPVEIHNDRKKPHNKLFLRLEGCFKPACEGLWVDSIIWTMDSAILEFTFLVPIHVGQILGNLFLMPTLNVTISSTTPTQSHFHNSHGPMIIRQHVASQRHGRFL